MLFSLSPLVCGSGGMFVQSAKFIENHSGNINGISVFGQDSNPTTWKMAQMNLATCNEGISNSKRYNVSVLKLGIVVPSL